ncbi:MAG: phosphoribosyl-AMP cyclohydrolase, partial [Candidatus Caldarchaeum sp.]|nr:phosphoribosyl-AMP cyclohydrolase [Candidatus Caldarchaeum sp.]
MKPEEIRFDDSTGLVPVVVQHHSTGEILMLAYANLEAVKRTVETGFAHFWSRSRRKLWMKGEESGNVMKVKEIRVDCDGDALLYLVDPAG